MRKNYIYAIFVFLLAFTSFGQKVTLTPTTVNGQSVSGGPINLGGTPNSTVGLGVTVEMPVIPGNSGTITIHSINGLNDNIVTGGNGGTLFFGEGKSASRSFVVNLLWSSFATSGSYIYAEYKTSGSVVYKSTYLAVTKNATQGGGTAQPPADAPDPSKIPNTLCCNQTVRLGDKPAPITGSQYLDPYKGQQWAVGSSWEVSGNPTVSILNLDDVNKVLTLDYVEQPGNFTVVRSLGSTSQLNKPYKSNAATITVVPSPILTNEISIDAPVNSNGFVEIINTNDPKRINGTRYTSLVNLTILQDPFHTSQRGDSFTNIERFEWEYTKTNSVLGGTKNWVPINGENNYFLESFNPSDISTTEDNHYLLRRIAIYQNIKRVSNTLKLVLRTIRNNNTICCDQTLIISASNTIDNPSLIVGSDATPEAGYLKYQWQSQSIDYNNGGKISPWSNIAGATSKDYLPPALQLVSNDRRGETTWTTPVTYNYRRVTEPQYYNGKYSYSNEINLSGLSYKNTPTIKVYPNPATSIINIENTSTRSYNGNTLSNSIITIVNIMGVPVISNNFSIINANLVSVDVSNLSIGNYFINIKSADGETTQKFTFIKN
ncbi:T9SS type A sorting domain-containing protein [Flavobacterium sp. UBA7680]|uniref:T9SS type A sorting domain-containing protein n=1 Tax=Flavobacterium sp. UBA7680 TaxID=1946559 RepID=UPI0025C3B884|nr:T9SS type A sorting domain-containing protein [Flavobacterium sp. UBA7680]